MNQQKIGSLIAKLRKEKKLTQQELADKLNVTDRAISNWENGRRIPDVSFFKPLCEILGITVNELINGETISKERIIETTDKTIIDTLNFNKKTSKKFKNIIKVLFIVIISLIIFLFVRYKNIYPKIDLYEFYLSHLDPGFKLEKKFSYKLNNKKYNVYYYGIENVQLCDKKDNCYMIKKALDKKQIDIEKIQKYFDKECGLGNNNKYILYDGGTTIYENKGFSIMFCNTTEGNKDIYIGSTDMIDKLNGGYCGKKENSIKSFTRTYQVISAEIIDTDFLNVTLKENNGFTEKVKIKKTNDIIVGKTYEFSFYAFDNFIDTIENIFKYCTLIKVKETDKELNDQINEEIYINDKLNNIVDLNELDNVIMEIKEGTLTNTKATIVITDLSGHKYIYGSEFRLDKKINNEWEEMKIICDNCAWTLMAYGPDKNNKLEFNCDWENLYGKLEKGKYRLVKTAIPKIEKPIDEDDILYFSVEFEIN